MKRFSRIGLIMLPFMVLVCLLLPVATPQAGATAADIRCTSLTAHMSADKNYEVLSAKATASPSSAILGYTFDFGDNESYSFTFPTTGNLDHTQATVNHTYEQHGTYRAIVTVRGDSTSANMTCQTTIVIGPAVAAPMTLVNTGSGNIFLIAASISLGAAVLYYILATKRRPIAYR